MFHTVLGYDLWRKVCVSLVALSLALVLYLDAHVQAESYAAKPGDLRFMEDTMRQLRLASVTKLGKRREMTHAELEENHRLPSDGLRKRNYKEGTLMWEMNWDTFDQSDDNTFHLSFLALNSTFSVTIRKNEHILHPKATASIIRNGNNSGRDKHYLSPASTFIGNVRVSPIHANAFEPYFSQVREGWASVIFYNKRGRISNRPTRHFEADFGIGTDTYRVSSLKKSLLKKRSAQEYALGSSDTLIVTKKTPLVNQHVHGSNVTGIDEESHEVFCGFHNTHTYVNVSETTHLHKFVKRAADGCPDTLKIVYMGVAADCGFAQANGGVDESIESIVRTWNAVSALYQDTFNVALGIVDINVFDNCDVPNVPWNRECSESYTMQQRLSDFSKWRGTRNADAGLWHLLTSCSALPVVGLSWGSTVCNTGVIQNSDGTSVSGTGVSSALGETYFEVVSHEIGHNCGASHDCTSNCGCSGQSCTSCCPCASETSQCNCRSQYLMNPTSGAQSTRFSPCTRGEICSTLFLTGQQCLQEPNSKPLFNGSICGNGIREGEEQCDCGGEEECRRNPCCTSDCTLKEGAQCNDGNGPCCENCKLTAANSKVCRSAKSDCDIQEMCDGTSERCPKDTVKEDGSSCNISGAYCASGQCTNRDLQCKMVAERLGSTGSCDSGLFQRDCALVCQTSSGCFQLGSNYIDGTECSGGRCASGECVGVGPDIFEWIKSNLWIIAVVIGVLILSVFACSLKKRK